MKTTYSVYTDLDLYCTKGIDSLTEAREIAERYAREGHVVEIRNDETGDTVELDAEDEEEDEMETKLWYAVMRDLEDNDWGTGSYDLDEARAKVNELRDDGYTDAYIAVIDMHNEADPVCVEEIHD